VTDFDLTLFVAKGKKGSPTNEAEILARIMYNLAEIDSSIQ
jgi:hypothetical protein